MSEPENKGGEIPPQTLEERVRALEVTTRNSMVRGFVLAFACFAILFYVQQFADRNNLLASCERGNDARAAQLSLFDALVEVNEMRVVAASSPAEAEANQYAVDRYGAGREALVASQASVAVEPGSVEIECGSVYPPPFPFDVG